MKRTKSRELLMNIILLLVTLFIVFIFLEGMVRLALPQSLNERYIADDNLIIRHTPLYEDKLFNDASGEWIDIKINSKGLRDYEYPYEKGDSKRVLVLGDSYTAALQVQLDETFSKQLETLLNEDSQTKFEVLNTGVDGWGNEQEFVYLMQEGVKYEPDYVILVFYILNDVENNLRRPVFTMENGELVSHVPFKHSKMFLLRRFLTSRSQLISHADIIITNNVFIMDKFGKLLKPFMAPRVEQAEEIEYDKEIFKKDLRPEFVDGWAETKLVLKAVDDYTNENDMEFLIVIMPDSMQLDTERGYKFVETAGFERHEINLFYPQDILNEFAEEEEINLLDLLPYFESLEEESADTLFVGHLTPVGHAHTAEAIYEKMDALWDIKEESP